MMRFVLLALLVLAAPQPGWAWGEAGHRIIAIIAAGQLTPAARAGVDALLAADPDPLTTPDIAARATWADAYRDSDRNGARERYLRTREWHFVDLELAAPDLAKACHFHPPAAVPASAGPAKSCIVDRIVAFQGELAGLSGTDAERILAFKFLLHLVGDVHQPLHATDDHDRGGNDVAIRAEASASRNLHQWWDVDAVAGLGTGAPGAVAVALMARHGARCAGWMTGDAAAWALDSFAVGRDVAYGLLPPAQDKVRVLDRAYTDRAVAAAGEQLVKAGCRLAMLLNGALR